MCKEIELDPDRELEIATDPDRGLVITCQFFLEDYGYKFLPKLVWEFLQENPDQFKLIRPSIWMTFGAAVEDNEDIAQACFEMLGTEVGVAFCKFHGIPVEIEA